MTEYELVLSGYADYGVVKYEVNNNDAKGRHLVAWLVFCEFHCFVFQRLYLGLLLSEVATSLGTLKETLS